MSEGKDRFIEVECVCIGMGLLKDLKRFWTGDYLTVHEVAEGFETSEIDAKERLESLAYGDGVLKEIRRGVYVPADDVDKKEMVREFNKKFSDLRADLEDELEYLEP